MYFAQIPDRRTSLYPPDIFEPRRIEEPEPIPAWPILPVPITPITPITPSIAPSLPEPQWWEKIPLAGWVGIGLLAALALRKMVK